MIKAIAIISVLTLSFSGFAQTATNTKTADKQAVDSACTAEATAAGCGSEQVGSGLLKCIGAYKKANKGFKLSPGCKAAIDKLKTDRAAKKSS